MDNKEAVISVKNVSKVYKIRERKVQSIRDRVFNIFSLNKSHKVHALKDINFSVYKGEFFGIIGHNGSGKSTLLNIIMQAIPCEKGGELSVDGNLLKLSLGIGFNLQLSAYKNIYINCSVLGMRKKQIAQIIDDIIDFAEIKDFINTPLKFYSTGMRSRLAFAIAIYAEAEIFLMDEFFGGVGDVRFKQKAEKVFSERVVKGRTIVHVSHNLSTIVKHCDRVLVLHKGEQKFLGDPEQAVKVYQNLLK